MKSGVFCCCFINHFLLLLAFERGCVWLCSLTHPLYYCMRVYKLVNMCSCCVIMCWIFLMSSVCKTMAGHLHHILGCGHLVVAILEYFWLITCCNWQRQSPKLNVKKKKILLPLYLVLFVRFYLLKSLKYIFRLCFTELFIFWILHLNELLFLCNFVFFWAKLFSTIQFLRLITSCF